MVKNTNNTDHPDIIETRSPTNEEEKWFDYVTDLPFKSDEYVTTFADKMLGLNTAVIAAYIAGLKLVKIPLTAYVFIPLVLFILSLFCSLYTLYPRVAKGEFNNLNSIKEQYLKAIFLRQRYISISFFAYFFGLMSSIIVILIG